MITVAPPASSFSTIELAIESGDAPVTMATSSRYGSSASPAASAAIRSSTSACSGCRSAHHRAWPAITSPKPAKRPGSAVISPKATRASSSRAMAHRSLNRTARRSSKTGCTSCNQPVPSSASRATNTSSSSRFCTSGSGRWPNSARMVRAFSARIPW